MPLWWFIMRVQDALFTPLSKREIDLIEDMQLAQLSLRQIVDEIRYRRGRLGN